MPQGIGRHENGALQGPMTVRTPFEAPKFESVSDDRTEDGDSTGISRLLQEGAARMISLTLEESSVDKTGSFERAATSRFDISQRNPQPRVIGGIGGWNA